MTELNQLTKGTKTETCNVTGVKKMINKANSTSNAACHELIMN